MTNEEFQKIMLEQIGDIKQSINRVENRLGNLEKRQESLEDELRTGENIQLTKALKYWTEDTSANLNCLLLNTASKDSIANLDKKIERIAGDVNFPIRKTTEHEDDIRSLKLAK